MVDQAQGAPPPPDQIALAAEPDHETTNAGAARVAAQHALLPRGWRGADRAIVRGTEYGLFAIGTLFAGMITLEVISRYLFSFSISFVNAAAKFLLVWFFLLGAGVALRHGAHVGFELLLTHVSPRHRRAIVLAGEFLALVFFVEMVWGGLHSLGPALRQTEPGLGISLVWAFLAIPVGFALLIYHMVLLIVVELRQAPDRGAPR
jgi:TRAP-type transport system small permease protein